LKESQNKKWDGCPLFFIRGRDQDIERLKRGGCYEREKQRGKGKQEGAAEKPQREEKDEEGEEEQVGLGEALVLSALCDSLDRETGPPSRKKRILPTAR